MEDMNFEELRQQFSILKEQLNRQEIVSDHLLRETMKAKRNRINSTKRMCYISVLIVLVMMPMNYLTHTWGMAFSIVTCIIMLLCAVATYYVHRPVDNLNFMTDDFATVARVMAKFKKQYDMWLYFSTPAILVLWLPWACYDLAWKHAPEGSNPWMMLIPLLVGAVIGAAIGFYYHFKAVNAAKDILAQIEE